MGRAPNIGIGRVSLLGAVAVREVVALEPFTHFVATTQFVYKLGIEPGLINS